MSKEKQICFTCKAIDNKIVEMKEGNKPGDLLCPDCGAIGIKRGYCPGCSGKVIFEPLKVVGYCEDCGGTISFDLPYESTEKYVANKFANEGEYVEEAVIYFDLAGKRKDGSRYRIHGWYDSETKLMTQSG